jgi:hypothetical protein
LFVAEAYSNHGSSEVIDMFVAEAVIAIMVVVKWLFVAEAVIAIMVVVK